MKKIAFISPGYLPLPSIKGGAVETLIDLLINSHQLNEKYELEVFSIYDINANSSSKKNNNVIYNYIKNTNIFEKVIRFVINKVLPVYIGNGFINTIIRDNNLNRFDYIIVENKPEYGLLIRKKYNGKLIFHSHNDFLNKDTKLAKKIVNCYDEIYCLSNFICNRVKEINKNSKTNIYLLYNGIDNRKFSENKCNKNKEREKYGIKPDDLVFLYTGRLVKEKGILELVRVFNKIEDNHYKLLIVGSIGYGKNTKDSYTEELKRQTSLNKNIIFTGFVDYDKIPIIYSIADYGIVPSMWEEPFALTVIEHFASGHPAIVTNSGAIPELVNENVAIIINKNNFDYEMLNAIKNISNTNFLESNKIKKYSFNFSKEKYVNRFIELVDKQGEVE